MSDSKDGRPPEAGESEHRPTLPERIERGVEHTVERVGDAIGRVEHAAEEMAEEVAGHVPVALRERVRWTVKRLLLVIGAAVAGAALVAAGISAYYVWNHTEWAAHELTGRVNSVLSSRSDVVLTVGAVRGNPLSSVEVLEPRVRFREGGAVLLEARAMRLRYSTWNLLSAKRGALVMELDRPVVHLTRAANGSLRLPTWRSSPSRAVHGRGFDFVVRIRDGDLILPDRERSIESFDLDAGAATGSSTRLEIRSLSWAKGPYGMKLDRLRGEVEVADSVLIDVRELESPDLALTATARWVHGGTRRVNADVARVRWSWLAKVFRNRTLDVPGEGRLSVQAIGDRDWRGEVHARGVWSDLALDSEGRFAWRDGRLTIDSLNGRSAMGTIAGGRLIWSKQGWEIGGTATDADPARWTVLGLKDWPAGRMRGRFRYAVDTRGRPSARLDARLESSTWAGWSADSAVVTVAFPAVATDSFHVQAWRRGGELTLDGRTGPAGWSGPYRIARFPLDEWPDGRASGLTGTLASGEGSVEARAGALYVTGTLEGGRTRWFGMEAARWRLEGVKGRLLPTPDLEARARLVDALYLGIHFDSAGTPCRLGDRTLALPSLTAWAGDTVLTMAAGADWTEGSWRMVATRAAAESRQFHWTVEPPLELAGDAGGVIFQRMVAADGDARLRIEGRWAVPGGSYDWRAVAEGLKLDRLGLPENLRLGGTADAELTVTGVAGNPRWEFKGRARGPILGGHVADSLRLSLSGAPSRLEVREFDLALGGGDFVARGSIEGTAAPWPDTLTAGGVLQWLAKADRWHGEVRADSMPLEPLTRLVGAEPGWTGRLGATIDLSGRPSAPRLTVRAKAAPIAWRNVRLDQVRAEATYADNRLRVTEFRTTRNRAVSNVTGEMEIALALGRTPEALDAPMHWRVDLPNGDLALFPVLVPQIGAATGRFEVDGEIRGTPRRPELVGTARIREGRLRLATRAEVLEDVRADFSFRDARITLDSLTALQRTGQGEPGRLRGRGTVDLHAGKGPTYAFDLALRDFTAIESGLYAARFDGDFRITNGARIGRQVLPHVTSDNVEIRRAVVLYDFARQTEQQQVQASTQTLFWTYRIQIHANDNLHWQPPDGNIEFSADLSVEQTPEKLVMFGDMDALRGTYYFLSNAFSVSQAKLTFDDVGGVDPLVDAVAVTRLRPTQQISERTPSQHKIIVKIQGRSSRPTVEFVDEPGNSSDGVLDQAQILQELTVGRFAQGQQVALSDPLNSYLTRAISRQLSAELSRAFRGTISEWEIARESSGAPGGGDLVVRVGSQLNDRLAVRYGQRLPGWGRQGSGTVPSGAATTLIERDLEAEYRISRFFYVTSQVTQKRPVSGISSSTTGTPDFNVNLKARWEY